MTSNIHQAVHRCQSPSPQPAPSSLAKLPGVLTPLAVVGFFHYNSLAPGGTPVDLSVMGNGSGLAAKAY